MNVTDSVIWNWKIIRAVGNAEDRFSEDALRMMRAIRFAAQLGSDIRLNTYNAIIKLAPNIKKVSAERIQVELTKTLYVRSSGSNH